MATSLQLWLSSRPPRTSTANEATIYGPDRSTKLWFEPGLTFETHLATHERCKGDGNAKSGPGRHIHRYQTEYFTVLNGKMGYEVDGKHGTLSAGEAEISIPPRVPHRFYPLSEYGDMTCQVRVDPFPGGLDECFLRNLMGYLSDVEEHKTTPSLFQIMLFFYTHDILIAFPLPLFLNTALHRLGAWIATSLLGYSPSYPEYFESQKDE